MPGVPELVYPVQEQPDMVHTGLRFWLDLLLGLALAFALALALALALAFFFTITRSSSVRV